MWFRQGCGDARSAALNLALNPGATAQVATMCSVQSGVGTW